MILKLLPDLPVLDLNRGLRAAVHEEQQDWSAQRPGPEGVADENVPNSRAHEEVKVGQDWHQEKGATEYTMEPATALWSQVGFLES